MHAKAANAYAKQKRTGYEKEIAEKSLDYLYRSFCLEPLGAFGDDAWRLIREVCGRDHPHAHDESCMWRRPDPKKDFVVYGRYGAPHATNTPNAATHTGRVQIGRQ